MAMTEIEKLKHFMKPYYQETSDNTLLQTYIEDYTYSECAAQTLWSELMGEAGMQMEGLQKIDTGAEKFVYSEPGTMQLACKKASDYYGERCAIRNNVGAVAVKVTRSNVAGLTQEHTT